MIFSCEKWLYFNHFIFSVCIKLEISWQFKQINLIIVDEALARQLQAEEETAQLQNVFNRSNDLTKQPVMPEVCIVRKSPPPSSLKEVMDEQMVIEISRKEYVSILISKIVNLKGLWNEWYY